MSDERESTIDQSMVITGDVVCTGRVVLEGKIEGSFSGQDLVIRESGQIFGQISGDSIECFGHIEGNSISKWFSLRKTGSHIGTVETLELKVEPGAVLDLVLQSGAMKDRERAPKVEKNRQEPPLDISKLLCAFREEARPCCMDIPWSERLELYSHLLELLEKGTPLIKVTGENGSGKSVLTDKLLKNLPESYTTLQVTNRAGSVSTLLREIAGNLEIEGTVDIASPYDLLERIKPVLDEKRKNGQHVVLLIDDAEKMYPATMEGITRLLGNGSDNKEKMLQMIILGTREMESKMVATTIEYFEDETNCQLSLAPLNIKDTADYLRFCLQMASDGDGSRAVSLFSNETMKEIHMQSRGNIAAINRLADKALQHLHTSGEAV